MAGKKVKTTVKAKATPTAKKSKAIKPKMGQGTGGFLTEKLIATVKKEENKKRK